MRLLSRRRIAWLRKIWAELVQAGNEDFTPHMEVDGYLAQIDNPPGKNNGWSRNL
jgi:hypothetical protein